MTIIPPLLRLKPTFGMNFTWKIHLGYYKNGLKSLSTVILFLLLSFNLSAADFESDGLSYNIIDDQSNLVEVTYGETAYSGSIAIPDKVTYNGSEYAVVAIGEYAFSGSGGIYEVLLPESLQIIDSNAFNNCTGLKSIDLPKNLTKIGKYAFCYCSSLEAVYLHGCINEVQDNAFIGCDKIAKVDLVDGTLSDWCSINFGNYWSTPMRGNTQFYLNGSLLTHLAIPSDIEEIKDYTFCFFSKIQDITIPQTVNKIGNYSFYGCWNASSLTISDSVTSIGYRAFYNCVSLTEVQIPASVTSIGSQAFILCFGLKSITVAVDNPAYSSLDGILYNKDQSSLLECPAAFTGKLVIPETTITIENNAFENCQNITEVTIPTSVAEIGDSAFYYCREIKNFYSYGETPAKAFVSTFAGCGNNTLHVPVGCLDAYRNAVGWKNFNNIVADIEKESTDFIYEYNDITQTAKIISSNKDIIDAVIPETVVHNNRIYTVTAIGENAFRENWSLISVTIPKTITEVGEYAFYNCENIKRVDISDLTAWCLIDFVDWSANPIYFSKNLYLNGQEIVNLVIPDVLTSIKDNTFVGLKNLKSVFIPNTIGFIGSNSFADCVSLTEIVIPNSVTRTGSWTFSGCSALSKVTLSNSLTSIGWGNFMDCVSLKTIIIPENIMEIEGYAFAGCILDNIIDLGSEPQLCHNIAFDEKTFGITDLCVAPGQKDAYENSEIWNRFKNITEYMDVRNGLEFSGYVYVDGHAEITGVDDSVEYARIPGFILMDGDIYTVTTLGEYAFESKFNLKTVELPSTLKTIGKFAFYNCSGLETVIFKCRNIYIDTYVFQGCKNINSVEITDLDTWCSSYNFAHYLSNPLVYAQHLYADGTEVTDLVIPESVVTVSSYAFTEFKGLKTLTVPDGVERISFEAFSRCPNLTDVVFNGNTLYVIQQYAFSGCPLLSKVEIPQSVVMVGPAAFGFCENLNDIDVSKDNPYFSSLDGILYDKDQTRILQYPAKREGSFDIPETVNEIASHAFYGCSKLTGVNIPSSVSLIDNAAFYVCENLTSIVIPDSVERISSMAFAGCTALKEILLGAGINYIGSDAFWFCDKVENVYSYSKEPPMCEGEPFADCYSAYLHVPAGTRTEYLHTNGWSGFSNILDDISGIDDIEFDNSNYPIEVYNLQGYKLNISNKDELNSLPKGIYIINGKKELLK